MNSIYLEPPDLIPVPILVVGDAHIMEYGLFTMIKPMICPQAGRYVLMAVRIVISCLLFGGAGGCSVMHSRPEPVPVGLAHTTDVAKLRPGLVISVSVLVAGKKEIDEPAKRISDMGTIALPLLGTLSVKDVSLDDVSAWLTDAYKKYYISPQVIVEFVRDNNSEGLSPWGYMTVLGRVKNPGRYVIPATQDLTVSGAIQKAGGFSSSANISAIVVNRRTSDGKVETRSVDLKAMGAGGRIEEDLIVNADDVVFVPELKF